MAKAADAAGDAPAPGQGAEAPKVDTKAEITSQAPAAVDAGVKDSTSVPVQTKDQAQARAAAFAAGAVSAQVPVAKKQVKIPPLPVVRQEPIKPFSNVTPLSDTPLDQWLNTIGSTSLAVLHEKLAYLDAQLGPGTQTSPEQAGKLMADAYKVLVNAIERETDDREFNAIWTLIMRMITETPKGGFSGQRLWRGKAFWTLSEPKFTHFEALWNLVDATVRHGKGYKSFVNEKKVLIGFSGPAQGRLGNFYRLMG